MAAATERSTQRKVDDETNSGHKAMDWSDKWIGEVNFYVTQIQSGDGYFRKYLHRMGKTASPYRLTNR